MFSSVLDPQTRSDVGEEIAGRVQLHITSCLNGPSSLKCKGMTEVMGSDTSRVESVLFYLLSNGLGGLILIHINVYLRLGSLDYWIAASIMMNGCLGR